MRLKSITSFGVALAFLVLVVFLLGGLLDTSPHTSDRHLASALIKIHEEQSKQNFTLSKSIEAIDQEIVDQLTKKVEKKTTNSDNIDIRIWFDNVPKFEASTRDVDHHPFFRGFDIENSKVCGTQPIDVLIYIQSYVEHRERRDLIRDTWGNTRLFHDVVVRTIFVLGMPEFPEEQMDVELEHSIFGDIVQGKFNDTFATLTYKAITTLVWINKNCPKAKVILKADDDIFVDIFRVVKEFIPLLDKGKESVICDFVQKSDISRDPKNKYYVPPKYLPSSVRWPPFCSGYFVLMTGSLIPMLYERSFQPDKFVPMDDAYLFGVLTDGMSNIVVTNVNGRVHHLQRPNPHQELRANGYLEYLAFAMPEKTPGLWKLKLEKLSDWERSHSLYVNLFETHRKGPVIIE